MPHTDSVGQVIEAVKELRTGYMFARDPCLDDIQERTGMSRPTVAKCINFLEHHGLIEVRKEGRRKKIVADQFSKSASAWF